MCACVGLEGTLMSILTEYSYTLTHMSVWGWGVGACVLMRLKFVEKNFIRTWTKITQVNIRCTLNF